MPLGNPTPSPAIGSQPWVPTRSYGGGAGKVFTNPWGAKTTAPKGTPMPPDDFGTHPFTGYKPKSKAESDALLDQNTPQGQMLKQQIETYRRELMKNQRQE